MIRLRKWFWDHVFLTSARLSNYALVKRSKACGCANCAHVATLLSAMKRRRGSQPDGHAVELN